MNKVVDKLLLPRPKPQHLRPPDRGHHYLNELTKAIETQVNPLVEAHNTATQVVGPTIASADTIAVSNAMHHISGTATINTITPSPGFSGQVHLIADGAFSLGNSGNIAIAKGPFTAGESISIVYDDLAGVWHPRS